MNLLDNPFYILGAGTRDDRRRLLERSEERALSADPTVCAKARADLTNPRNRIISEVAWLPGCPQDVAERVLRLLERDAMSMPRDSKLNPLAAANLAASILARGKKALPVDQAVQCIEFLSQEHERTDPDEVLRSLNEDRAAAGFPLIGERALLDHALAERRTFYKDAVWAALDKLPTQDLVAVLAALVERMSEKGRKHAPLLIDQIIDAFEAEGLPFLEQEAANAHAILEVVRQAANAAAPRHLLEPLLSGLERVVRNWDSVAQPIQLSSMSRGLDHSLSVRLASEVRDVAVELHNECGLLWVAQSLTAMIGDVFVEVPRIVEYIEKDIVALERLASEEARAQAIARFHAAMGRGVDKST